VRRHFVASVVPLLVALGCGEPPPKPVSSPKIENIAAGSRFQAGSAGTIHGQVAWVGNMPAVPPFEGWGPPLADNAPCEHYLQPNPNAPAINPATRGVANAVVFLRGVDPAAGKVWNLDPVRLEQRGRQCHVLQGTTDSHYGFVQRGDAVQMVSRDPAFHSLHAGGAAFFTLAFPDPDQARTRVLDRTGIVEMTSAAGYYWMRAYLFVDEHPYYTRTDAQGRFHLDQVPPGAYDLVCWLPNWTKARHEREPESGLVIRYFFNRPAELTQPVHLEPKREVEVQFTPSEAIFQP
jgi:hypothetical protein